MKLKIISFGQISDFMPAQQIEISGISHSDQLKHHLETSFPKLVGMKYKMAINQKIIHSNQQLTDKDEVAVMPPFSGG